MCRDFEAAALLQATRTAFDTALQQLDLRAVRGPLEQFWQLYPNCYPRNSARCYPHGHLAELPALECQSLAFSRMVAGMLASLPEAPTE